jgi:uncharacterized GH25 family protein
MTFRVAAISFGLLLLSRTSAGLAHDFWVEPGEYWVSAGASTSMTLQVGHGPYRERSPIPARRITQFQAIAPDGTKIDLHDRLQLGGVTKDGDFSLHESGTYVLVLQTDDRAQTHLPSIRFNDYLKAEGLTPALEQRARLHRMDADGSERYSRCAKSFVQIGPVSAGSQESQDQINKPVGLPLEIVPEVNPYRVPRPTTLPVRVLYEGQPLAGALVKLTDLSQDASPFEVHVSDDKGRAIFPMPRSGTWLLNVIWTKALGPSDETDFDTIFSSLSFGFP